MSKNRNAEARQVVSPYPFGVNAELSFVLISNAAQLRAASPQTRLAVEEVMTDPRWDGKTVVMAWVHDHIANPDLPSDDTLRGIPAQRKTL